MKDIELDFINKKIKNNYVSKQDRISQQIKVAIRTWVGDFFINTNFGIDYDSCWGDMTLMKSYLIAQIKDIDGVFAVSEANIAKKKDSNNETYFEFNAKVSIDNGSIDISEIIGEKLDGYSI